MAKAQKKSVKKPALKSKNTAKSKSTVKGGSRKTLTTVAASKPAKAASSIGPVLEYKLFCEDSVRGLEDQVNYYIGKGWSPVGGVVIQASGNYMQTMVRHQN